jgi:hypothetical protein
MLMKRFRPKDPNQGYVLALTLGLGVALMMLGLTAALVVQTDRKISAQRRETALSLAIVEGSADRVMAQLSNRNNRILIGRNYDPINPQTGRTFLGDDGQPNSGDETATPVDQWTSYNPSGYTCFQAAGVGTPTLPLTGTIGGATYRLLAYRYNASKQLGYVLVEGQRNGRTSRLLLSLHVKPDWQNFPSIVGLHNSNTLTAHVGAVGLRSRRLLGNANVYFSPYSGPDSPLTGFADTGDSDRADYLNSIWAEPNLDGGATIDPVPQRISACHLMGWPNLPTPSTGTTVLDGSTTLTGTAGQVTRYWYDQISLDGTDTVTVDTTEGPVEIILKGDPDDWSTWNMTTFVLADDAKIVNVRTDGQTPRTGDLKVINMGHFPLSMYGRSCIQTAFLWLPVDELWLMTDGAGCPSGRNSSIEGVVWAEAILSSKNSPSNRDIAYLGNGGLTYDTMVTPNVTAGIFVPDDLSSLANLLVELNLPTAYQFQGIASWQQVR